jgi:uncharacterized protein YbaR (Trm112 family)
MASTEPSAVPARHRFDPELLKILCCPETRQELRLAETELLERINRRISEGGLKNRGGQPVSDKIEAGLVRADGKFLYPMRLQIPVLLVDEGIAID